MPSPVEIKIFNSLAMSASKTSDKVEMLYLEKGAIQLVWSGADTAVGKVYVEISCEPMALNFVTIPKGEINIATASGTALAQMPDICYRWMRLRYEPGSNTAGSISAYAVFK